MGLVDVDWVRAHGADADVRLIDVRWYLSPERRGRDAYLAGHLPGACFVDLDTALAGPDDGTEGRHPLPSSAVFEQAMRDAGVSRITHVVAYDDAGGAVAARLWWLLRAYGHSQVSLLDGGLPAWVAAGGELETAEPAVVAGDFVATRTPLPTVDIEALPRAQQAGALLVDVRAPERYRGDVEPIDPRPGHIPGAVNVPVASLLKDGRFRSKEALVELLAPLTQEARSIIASCGSGVTACHLLFALDHSGVLPFPQAWLYAGSYSDWSRRQALPVVVGHAPGASS